MILYRRTFIPHLSAGFMLVMGAAFILASPPRWTGRSFRPALALADPWVWGVLLTVAGLTLAAGIVTGHASLRVAGYLIAATWCGFFGLTFMYAVITDKQAALTGAIVYTYLANQFTILGRTARRPPTSGD